MSQQRRLNPSKQHAYQPRLKGAKEVCAICGARKEDPVHNVRKEPRGQTLVEYGLLIALIAIVVIAALLFLGPIISGLFNNIGNTLQNGKP